MRVTKIIREYVGKIVMERVYAKYSEEKKEAERQKEIFNKIKEEANEVRERAELDYIRKACKNFDFIEFNEEKFKNQSWGYLTIKDEHNNKSVHCWKNRANDEAKEIIDNILVTCELGGTKKELDEMLFKI